jgi:NodT family efflux transporter outer membrane factor (OMF) lipoprotein
MLMTGCFLQGKTVTQINIYDLTTSHVYKIPDRKTYKNCLKKWDDPQLHQLVSLALTDNPDIRIALGRIAVANQMVNKAYSVFFPSVDLKSSIAQDHFSFQGKVPAPFNELLFNKATISDVELQFNYELDLWGKNRAIFASKLNESFAAKMDLEETRLILTALIASSYFQLQNNLAQQRLAKENVSISKELEAIVLDRAKQGVESDIPVKTAISNTQAAILALENYKLAERQALHQLAALIGKSPLNTKIEVMPFNYSFKRRLIPKIIPANILGQRPDIVATRARAQSAAHQIKIAKTAFLPNINLSGILSFQSFYFSKLFHIAFETEGVKAALELPIFDAGARRANLGARYAEFDIAVAQYNKTIINALKEVADQISTLTILRKQIYSQAKSLSATEGNYRIFQQRYKEGVIDYVQLLEIKKELLERKGVLIQLQTQSKQAVIALLAALGSEIV